jgi:hypothetical protein
MTIRAAGTPIYIAMPFATIDFHSFGRRIGDRRRHLIEVDVVRNGAAPCALSSGIQPLL